MTKISRNDPCPCGSGKKYKKCCIDKILSFPITDKFQGDSLKTPTEFSEMVKQHFANRNSDSLDDLNSELATISDNYNSLPKAPFLGLSPSQMHVILNTPLGLDNLVFSLEAITANDISKIPILTQCLFFLRKLGSAGELKATQKGNLPKKMVIELYEEFYSEERYSWKPSKEDDLPVATELKNLLDISGLIKKRNNKFSLTKKGHSLLEEKKMNELFELVFLNLTNKLNWGYFDGYPDLDLIQQSACFNFLMIHRKCKDWTLGSELGQIFLEAFPSLVIEVPLTSYSSPERDVVRCFELRFLRRYCVPLGILEFREEKVKKGEYFEYVEYYKSTLFFESHFKFLV